MNCSYIEKFLIVKFGFMIIINLFQSCIFLNLIYNQLLKFLPFKIIEFLCSPTFLKNSRIYLVYLNLNITFFTKQYLIPKIETICFKFKFY